MIGEAALRAPEVDEFDLDVRVGDLVGWTDPLWSPLDAQTDPAGCQPTGGAGAEGGTCNTNDNTCAGTCAGRNTCPNTQCGNTCANTCPNTCPNTCANTCANTCPNTCAATCGATCGFTCDNEFTCGGTQCNTHCFSCRCERP